MIQPPNWKKDAIPTTNGWTHPGTGELLKSMRISNEQVAEWQKADKKEKRKLAKEAKQKNLREVVGDNKDDNTLNEGEPVKGQFYSSLME